MTLARRNILAALLVNLACGSAFAQQDKPLPNVLIIGDSVYSQFVLGAVAELKGQANVQFAKWPNLVLPNSTNAIGQLDLLLGLKDANGNDVPEARRTSWGLIHFNVGLSDLIHCVPNIKSHRALSYDAGGVPRTEATQYEKNLDTLVKLLRQKAPGARIVWASTTPVRHSRENVHKPGLEIEYNQTAERVMKRNNVPINNMYAYAASIMDMAKPIGHMDPYYFDKKPLHPPVTDVIVRELKLKPIKREAIQDGK